MLNINPAWTATLGWTPDDLVGKTGEWLIHPDDREKSFGELVSLRAGKPSEHFENRIQCKDGSYRWLSWRARLQIDRPDMPSLGTSLISSKPKSNCTRYAASLPNHLVKLRLAP